MTSTIRDVPKPAVRSGLLFVGVLLIAANLRASITAVGPVLDDVQRDLHLGSVEASVLISLPLLAFALVSPLAPALARRIGIERTLGLALGLLAVGIVLRSLPGLALLWTGTAALGVAIAILNVMLPALVKRDFPHRIGQVTGLYSAVQSSFAAVAAGLAVPIAGASESGWRLAFGIWAGLALIGLGVFAPQLRLRSVPPEEDVVTLGELRHPAPAGRSPWRTALGWQVTLFMGLQSVAYYVLVTWLATIERSDGISAATAGVHQLLFNALAIAGSLASAALIPRFRDQRLIAAVAPAFLVAAVLGLLLAPGLAVVWACLAGISGGGSIVLALSLFGLRTTDHTQAAALSGMAQSVGYLLAAGGPIAIGALHDATASWHAALIALLVVTLAQIVFGVLAARNRFIG